MKHQDCPLCSKHVFKSSKDAEHSDALHWQLEHQDIVSPKIATKPIAFSDHPVRAS